MAPFEPFGRLGSRSSLRSLLGDEKSGIVRVLVATGVYSLSTFDAWVPCKYVRVRKSKEGRDSGPQL